MDQVLAAADRSGIAVHLRPANPRLADRYYRRHWRFADDRNRRGRSRHAHLIRQPHPVPIFTYVSTVFQCGGEAYAGQTLL